MLEQQRRVLRRPPGTRQSRVEDLRNARRKREESQREAPSSAMRPSTRANKRDPHDEPPFSHGGGKLSYRQPSPPRSDCGSLDSSDSGSSTETASEQFHFRTTERGGILPVGAAITKPSFPSPQEEERRKAGTTEWVAPGEEAPSPGFNLKERDEEMLARGISALNPPEERIKPHSESGIGEEPKREQRSRCFSFEKADDEVLPLSPTEQHPHA